MEIPCTDIRKVIEERLATDVSLLVAQGKRIQLTTVLIGSAEEQLSFVQIKQKLASRLGIGFRFIHLKKTPLYESFIRLIKEETSNPATTGIIIQLPLPHTLQSDTLYSIIPVLKEVEGHREKSPFLPPIGRAVLTGLKYAFFQSLDYDKILVQESDKTFFHSHLKFKKVVLIGRGLTGGLPIGKTLTHFGIPYVNISSSTDPTIAHEFIGSADVIITAVGKQVITPDMIKTGAILLNVGLRSENGKLRGDYDETEIAEKAGAYTPTPRGLGPIDVLYMFRNLVDAAQLQTKSVTVLPR
ncbi:MAG: bifunctional 5,10-methylenetetrahydrofolate dehydrogenase/5,10-methenyltetrahydrofolate cyclohydrolase [Patescibacteria group bacterium]|nr:bifunctional 5,10-methylenetetrahydrofolate dehydrogenase/5,10-methenyltetrahydrofolate cyclohydrolase [Patescibacteria group bacterium]